MKASRRSLVKRPFLAIVVCLVVGLVLCGVIRHLRWQRQLSDIDHLTTAWAESAAMDPAFSNMGGPIAGALRSAAHFEFGMDLLLLVALGGMAVTVGIVNLRLFPRLTSDRECRSAERRVWVAIIPILLVVAFTVGQTGLDRLHEHWQRPNDAEVASLMQDDPSPEARALAALYRTRLARSGETPHIFLLFALGLTLTLLLAAALTSPQAPDTEPRAVQDEAEAKRETTA